MHIQSVEQGIEVAAVLDEAVRAGATVRELVRVAHADQVGGDAAASWLQMRQHVPPQVRRGGIAVQEHDGIALSHLHVRHLAAEDPPPLLLIRKCCGNHVRFSLIFAYLCFSFLLLLSGYFPTGKRTMRRVTGLSSVSIPVGSRACNCELMSVAPITAVSESGRYLKKRLTKSQKPFVLSSRFRLNRAQLWCKCEKHGRTAEPTGFSAR